MPEPESIQPKLSSDPATPPDNDLLDQFCLNTVLEMLAVIDCVEELALLETLTAAQKRQVWDATPEALKVRLKQIRAASHSPSSHSTSIGDSPNSRELMGEDETGEDETGETTFEDELFATEESEEALAAIAPPFDSSDSSKISFTASHELIPVVGDWIVLKAEPKLSAAELIAIWEVVEMEGEYARIKAKSIGVRLYPANWMIVYPKLLEMQRSDVQFSDQTVV